MLSTPLRLKADGSASVPIELSQQKQFDWPIHFRGVIGADKSDTLESGFAGDSWSNLQEAEAVADMIVNLAFDQGVPVDRIGVMVRTNKAILLCIRQPLTGWNFITIIFLHAQMDRHHFVGKLACSVDCFGQNN